MAIQGMASLSISVAVGLMFLLYSTGSTILHVKLPAKKAANCHRAREKESGVLGGTLLNLWAGGR